MIDVFGLMVHHSGQRSGDGELPSTPPEEDKDEEEEEGEGRVPVSRSEARLKALMRDELLMNVTKFSSMVNLN